MHEGLRALSVMIRCVSHVDLQTAGDEDWIDPRRNQETQEHRSRTNQKKMVELLSRFTPEQMNRYECYRRAALPKHVLRRLFHIYTGTFLNPNGLLVLAAVGKLFVGELVETARQVAEEQGSSDLDQIQPIHIREARVRLQGDVWKGRSGRQLFKFQRL